jgi:hypothetical protein
LRRISNIYDNSIKVIKREGKRESQLKEISERRSSKLTSESGDTSSNISSIDSYIFIYNKRPGSKPRKFTFWEALFTFIKVNIVSGFLFLPCGYKTGGWLFSIICTILVSIMISICNILLANCTDLTNSFSFSELGDIAIGSWGKHLIQFGVAISGVIKINKNSFYIHADMLI